MSGETDGNKLFQAENHETSKKSNSMFYHVVLPAETLRSNAAVLLLLRVWTQPLGPMLNFRRSTTCLELVVDKPQDHSIVRSDAPSPTSHRDMAFAPSYHRGPSTIRFLAKEKTGMITEIASLRSASAPLIIPINSY